MVAVLLGITLAMILACTLFAAYVGVDATIKLYRTPILMGALIAGWRINWDLQSILFGVVFGLIGYGLFRAIVFLARYNYYPERD